MPPSTCRTLSPSKPYTLVSLTVAWADISPRVHMMASLNRLYFWNSPLLFQAENSPKGMLIDCQGNVRARYLLYSSLDRMSISSIDPLAKESCRSCTLIALNPMLSEYALSRWSSSSRGLGVAAASISLLFSARDSFSSSVIGFMDASNLESIQSRSSLTSSSSKLNTKSSLSSLPCLSRDSKSTSLSLPPPSGGRAETVDDPVRRRCR
mmetsp:Transcript_11476/g.31864  ORF Transcript_11476/g.31864 Transcript_11476/m.31864 type:complete len:209 (+) Transcript_11476:1238-1864(+)